MAVQVALLSLIQKHDPNGNLQTLILECCAPPLVPNPTVMWRCAASARFLHEMVQQVHSKGQRSSMLNVLCAA